jgi:hypothetical protein
LSNRVFNYGKANITLSGVPLPSGNNNIGSILNSPAITNTGFYVATVWPYLGHRGPASITETISDYGVGYKTYYYWIDMIDTGIKQEVDNIQNQLFKPHERLLSLDCLPLAELLFG